jgi:Phosphotransferase enzyme family
MPGAGGSRVAAPARRLPRVADEEVLQDRADRPVVRVGATVRHPLQPWTPAVHALLDRLAAVGFPYSPRVLGVDGETEILSYIDGESGPAGWAKVVDEAGLQAAAGLLRAYHDAIRGWAPEPPPRWFTGQVGTGGPGEVVCHGDFGPWNIVWHGTRPVGLLDWEYAHPAPPREDVAYALEYVAPFRSDAECVRWLRYPRPPDRRRRLELFAAAYGLPWTAGLVDEVIAVQRAGLERVRRLAAGGHERQVRAAQAGEPEMLQQRIRWSEAHRFLFE